MSSRSKAVRNQQKRLLDHIFGDRQFKIYQIDEVCERMKKITEDEKFMNNGLITVNREIGKDKMLSVTTISTFVMAMTVLFKYIVHKDDDVQKAATKAMQNVKQ